MKRIIRIRHGEKVPNDAKHISSAQEPDPSNSYYTDWMPTKGIMGLIPIFGTESKYKITPLSMFHYYEIEE